MGITLENRQERHLMRQRGAGVRSITANFAFVFQAGPVEIQAPGRPPDPVSAQQDESSCPSNQSAPETGLGEGVPKIEAPKKLDAAGSVERTTLDPHQETVFQANERIPDRDGEIASERPQVETKRAKRKPASKRFAAPKTRQARHTRQDLQAVPSDAEPPLEEASPPTVPEGVQQQETETKPKRVANSTKRNVSRPKKHVPVLDEDEDDELSNDSLPSIISSKPTSRKRTANAFAAGEPLGDTAITTKKRVAAQPKGEPANEASIPRKKGATTSTRGGRPTKKTATRTAQEEHHLPACDSVEEPEAADIPVSSHINAVEMLETSCDARQEVETGQRKKRTAVDKPTKTTRSRAVKAGHDALIGEASRPAKLMAKRKRNEDTDHLDGERTETARSGEVKQMTEALAKSNDTVKPRGSREAKHIGDNNLPERARREVEKQTVDEADVPRKPTRNRALKTATLEATEALPEEENRQQTGQEEPQVTSEKTVTRSKRVRQPLGQRDSNESPQKPAIDLERDTTSKASEPKTKRAAVRRPANRSTKAAERSVTDDISQHRVPAPPAAIGLGITFPEEGPAHEETADVRTEARRPPESKPPSRTKKARKSVHVHEDLDFGLFDTGAPAPAPKKATMTTKKTKRVFKDDDDDEMDLDAMLDGIAAIVGDSAAGGSSAKAATDAKTGRKARVRGAGR